MTLAQYMKNTAVVRIGQFHMQFLTLIMLCAFKTIYHSDFTLAYNSYSNQNDIL